MVDLDQLGLQLAKQCNGGILRAKIIQRHLNSQVLEIFKIILQPVWI